MSDESLLHKFGHIAYEATDLLFGIDAIKKIAQGKGTWGDAANVGITAATFYFPPLKLFKLAPEALHGIASMGEKVLADEATKATMSKIAVRQLEETVADAKVMREIKSLPHGQQGSAFNKYIVDKESSKQRPGPLSRLGEDLGEMEKPIQGIEKSREDIAKLGKKVADREARNVKVDQRAIDREAELAKTETAGDYTGPIGKQEVIRENVKPTTSSKAGELMTDSEYQVYSHGLVDAEDLIDTKALQKEIESLIENKDSKLSKETADAIRDYADAKRAGIEPPEYAVRAYNDALELRKGEHILKQVDKEIPAELPKEEATSIDMEELQAGLDARRDTYGTDFVDEVSEWNKSKIDKVQLQEDIWGKDADIINVRNPKYSEGLTAAQADKVDHLAKLKLQIERFENYNKKKSTTLSKSQGVSRIVTKLYEKDIKDLTPAEIQKVREEVQGLKESKNLLSPEERAREIKIQKQNSAKIKKLNAKFKELGSSMSEDERSKAMLLADDMREANKYGIPKSKKFSPEKISDRQLNGMNSELENLKTKWANETDPKKKDNLKAAGKALKEKIDAVKNYRERLIGDMED